MATRQTNYSQRTFPITSGPNTPTPPTRPRIDGRRDPVGAGCPADRPSKLGRTPHRPPRIDGNAPDKPPTTDIPITSGPNHTPTPPRPSINGDPPLPVDDHLVVAGLRRAVVGNQARIPGITEQQHPFARGRPDDHGQQPGHQQQPQPIAELPNNASLVALVPATRAMSEPRSAGWWRAATGGETRGDQHRQ